MTRTSSSSEPARAAWPSQHACSRTVFAPSSSIEHPTSATTGAATTTACACTPHGSCPAFRACRSRAGSDGGSPATTWSATSRCMPRTTASIFASASAWTGWTARAHGGGCASRTARCCPPRTSWWPRATTTPRSITSCALDARLADAGHRHPHPASAAGPGRPGRCRPREGLDPGPVRAGAGPSRHRVVCTGPPWAHPHPGRRHRRRHPLRPGGGRRSGHRRGGLGRVSLIRGRG